MQIGHTGPPGGAGPLPRDPGGGPRVSDATIADDRRRRSTSPSASSRSSATGPAGAEAEVTVRSGHRRADPVRERASSTRTWPRRSTTSCSASRSTGGSHRRASTGRPTTRHSAGSSTTCSTPPGSARPTRTGRACAADRRRPTSTTGTTRRPRPTPTTGPRRVAGVRRRRRRASRRPATARRPRSSVAFANSAGQRADRSRDRRPTIDGIARTPTADGSGRDDLGPARRPRRPGRRRARRDARPATRQRPDRPRARAATRSSSSRTASPNILGVPARSTASTARPSRRAGRSPGSASRSSTRRSRCATTSPTRGRSGSRSTSRARRSGRVDLVRDGVTAALLHTRRTAAQAAPASRARATRVEGGAAWGALGANLVVWRPAIAIDRRADRRRRARRARHRLLVHPDPRPADAGRDRADAQRRVADRGRPGRPAGHEPAVHAVVPRGARAGRGPRRSAADAGCSWSRLGTRSYLVPSLHLASWNFTGGAKG